MSDEQVITKTQPFDGVKYKELMNAGLTWLRTNQESVNALNVFPVPDGDTGTNMVLTLQAAYNEISNSHVTDVGVLAGKLAHGALMGARGNSGVILSQIWRGFSKGVEKCKSLDGKCLVEGLKQARDTAYKGVVRPVEGTILTVCKDMALAAEQGLKETADPYLLLKIVTDAAQVSVDHTPELLEVLKEAGVVDAGGKGLMHIFEGMIRYLDGEPLDIEPVYVQPLSVFGQQEAMNSAEPGQDYEVIVDFQPHKPLELGSFYEGLEEIGTSIQVGEGDGIYRMHIHVPTDKRYEPIDYTMTLGTITKVHIENLMIQMDSLAGGPAEEPLKFTKVSPGEVALVTISPGVGFSRIFASLGAAAIVEGGQTMNPSTQEILAAFEDLPTDQIIILPNNKNILMAANTAAEVSVKHVKVVPSVTVPQGLAAMLRLIPGQKLDEVAEDMGSAIKEIESGEITTAVRDVEIDGIAVKEGEIISLHNGKLVGSNKTLKEGCLVFLESAKAEDFELITMFQGENITQEEAQNMMEIIQEVYPDQVVELQYGGQPHYQFILSIE
ncbi:MAG: DAK2 domain-containing protein [Anaerolineales bacterium]|nr:MAG: DAK2 domain-containing protein [Anaerolineales bacterium]